MLRQKPSHKRSCRDREINPPWPGVESQIASTRFRRRGADAGIAATLRLAAFIGHLRRLAPNLLPQGTIFAI
jgi:hypothetical protein